MTLTDTQHRAWFVASLTPYLRTTLSQQKLSTQASAKLFLASMNVSFGCSKSNLGSVVGALQTHVSS